ncbi:hypothetical protein F5Y10DRAFT_267220 [Nemania abortiva]|nr:hypothetical protein F5Y10DRAFT_267220 [Nemania abortiva]
MPRPDKLHMSGHVVPSRGFAIQQVRIYLNAAKPAPMRYEEPELVGEAALMALGVPRVHVLNLDYSWGVGVETWAGPTTGGYQSSPSLAFGPQAGMPAYADDAPKTSLYFTRPTPHRMNPEAAEFYPNITVVPVYKTHAVGYPSASRSPSTSLSDQYSENLYSGQNSGYIPMGGYCGTQIDPMAPIPPTQDNAGAIWDPYAQRWQIYNYNIQQWEFPGPFGYV